MRTKTIKGKDSDFNRKALENRDTRALILNHTKAYDKLYQRDSGLNHILCKIAKKNNVEFQLNFNELIIDDKKTKAKILSRWIQNIMLFKKFKNKVKVINFNKTKSEKNSIQALLITLGMPTNMAKKSVD